MRFLNILVLVGLFLFSQSVFSRDSVQGFSIADALTHEKAQSVLGDQVEFYFGEEIFLIAQKKNLNLSNLKLLVDGLFSWLKFKNGLKNWH